MATKKKKVVKAVEPVDQSVAQVILGCDLSVAGSGFGVIEVKDGKIQSAQTHFVDNSKARKYGNGYRIEKIAHRLEAILERTKPDRVAIERGFQQFPTATQLIYRVVGVTEMILFQHGHDFPEMIAPTSIKKTVTGHGKATKGQVAEAVQEYLPERMVFKTDDESDSLAVAIAYALEKKLLDVVTSPATTLEK